MKTSLVILIAFAGFLFVGCQENSITDPLTTEAVSKVNDSNPVKYGLIKLEGMLNDPHHVGNSFYIVRGQIDYEHRMIAPLPMQPVHRYYVSLKLIINADISYFCSLYPLPAGTQLAGTISKTTEEYVTLNERFKALLEKSFIIQGQEDRMVLKCRFLVREDGIELSAMWLALDNQSVTATVNQ